ncbi:hypothetical protein AB0M02_32345 [Actinoplanes sp. NPDC051861]|uniref:fibronectin type III domain-containing protein n=1 Tax=Actinoplanes sp. NPDC051861 TaxID=3155170 RepID=UPI00342F56FC
MSRSLRRRGAVLIAAAVVVASAAPPAAAAPPGPATPAGLWASTIGTGVSLAWEQPRVGSPATSFRVYEDDTVVARVSTTTASLEVPFGSSHNYTVSAVDRRGRESARTAPVTGRSWLYGYNPECMPISAVPISITGTTATAISVSWARHPLGGDLELRLDGQSLGWTAATGARIGGLAPGSAHQVTLYRTNRCHIDGGGAVQVASLTATTTAGSATPPSAPSGLTVTGQTDTTVGLAWSAPAGSPPARYAIYDGATLVAVTAASAVTVDRLHHATRHRFTVAALDSAGNESAHSSAVTAATADCMSEPPRPVVNEATALSPGSVRLSWSVEAAASSYTVFDRDVEVATTRYPHIVLSGLPSASGHAYRVLAVLQACGETPRSRRTAVTTPAGPVSRPEAPAGLALTGNVHTTWPSGAEVTLSWSGSAGTYRVYEGATPVGETSGTSLTLPVGAATTHEYTVVAVDAAGLESAPSPPLTVRATYLPPP